MDQDQAQKNQEKCVISANKQSKLKERICRSSNSRSCKYVGVRQRPSGKWVAEIKDTTREIRMWLGTFQTPEEAACAYDEAACLLRGSNTRTNFATHVTADSHLSLKIRKLLDQKKSLKHCVPTETAMNSSNTLTDQACTTTNASVLNMCISTVTGPKQETQMGDDGAYRPDLSSYNIGEFVGEPWRVQAGGLDDDQIPYSERLALGKNDVVVVRDGIDVHHDPLSASLYDMNGVNEYLEINGYDPSDPFWDLPALCHLFCPT